MNEQSTSPAHTESFFGRMNDPTASGGLLGPCGDTMEFHLRIQDNVINDIRYHTDGCANTRACGREAARQALGRTVGQALSISAGTILEAGVCKPGVGRHCAILSVSALYSALADYLLRP